MVSAKSADELNHLSQLVIGIAIDIHKKLGPGFQSSGVSAYQAISGQNIRTPAIS